MLTLLALTSYLKRKYLENPDCKYLRPSFWPLLILMALEERFRAAVRVIQSLPKDGPYQPSNSTKLQFYSLFKQATEGKCSSGRPSVWNIIGRAKWDAWDKLGDMSQEAAMSGYIEELKKIIETMSFSGDVQEFLDSIGPFYEFVNLEGAEMSHIKEALDAWTSSSSSFSNSSASSNNNSPEKLPLDSLQADQSKISSDELLTTTPPIVKKSNGYLPNHDHDHGRGDEQSSAEQEIPRASSSSAFTAPPAPVHRASLKNQNLAGMSNGFAHNGDHEHDHDNENSDEVLEIDEVSHEYQIHHNRGKVSIDSIQSGTESEKYYSGDSEPEIDIEEKYAAMAFREEALESRTSPRSSSGGGIRHRVRHTVGPYHEDESSSQLYCGSPDTRNSEIILRNTVERMNRDVDHILARLRILETAYASNGQIPGLVGQGQMSQIRRKRWFGELSPRSLTLILTWPFVAYFIIKLLKWWFTRRFRRNY